jgi:hypothetical protein
VTQGSAKLALRPVVGPRRERCHPISRLNSGSSSFALAGDTVTSSIGQHPVRSRRPAGIAVKVGRAVVHNTALGDPPRIHPPRLSAITMHFPGERNQQVKTVGLKQTQWTLISIRGGAINCKQTVYWESSHGFG